MVVEFFYFVPGNENTGPVSLELLFVPFSHIYQNFPMFTRLIWNTNHDK